MDYRLLWGKYSRWRILFVTDKQFRRKWILDVTSKHTERDMME
jgi:hypothetical protein